MADVTDWLSGDEASSVESMSGSEPNDASTASSEELFYDSDSSPDDPSVDSTDGSVVVDSIVDSTDGTDDSIPRGRKKKR